MNRIVKRLLTGVVTVCLLTSTALAAQITPSPSHIELTDKQTTVAFDITLKADAAFAGAEFGIKPSSQDVALQSLTFLEDTRDEAQVKTVKNGVLYFGFFAGNNKFPAGTYHVARLMYTYAGTAPRTISLDSSKIVTIDEETDLTVGDTTSAPFTVTITRASSGGGGGAGGGGGGGGGGPVTPPVEPQQPEVKPDIEFVDVHKGDYCYDAVKWAVERGITKGTTATTFSPNAGCTRGQMVTFLWRAAGCPEPADSTMRFTDVSIDSYCGKAVLWAVERGITKGLTETTFAPEAVCTRGQTVTFLYRNAGSPAVSGTGFADVSTGSFCANAVIWAAQKGITKGLTETTFAPNAVCTRGQIVTFLYRANAV